MKEMLQKIAEEAYQDELKKLAKSMPKGLRDFLESKKKKIKK